MSKITNDGLTHSGTGCFIAVPVLYGNSVLQRIKAEFAFLPARRYASAGYRDRNVSVSPSVHPSVCHAPVLCQNEES